MPAPVLILPSPLLGEGAYDDLVVALADVGVLCHVADGRVRPGADATDLLRRWSALADASATIVAHSNAGYLAPSVRGHERAPMVFMDAALPPSAGATTLAPPGLRGGLADLADHEGRLPPWTRWWPREELADVIPEDRFADIDGACPRLPLRYFDSRVTVPDGWAVLPNAYLAFGTTYAEQLAFAGQRSWPTRALAGGHLQFLHDPAGVASAIVDLVTVLAE